MTSERDGRDVHLAEYERIRCEIDGRTQLAFGLVTLNVTALGVGLSAFVAFPDIVYGLAALSCVLWMLYVDHSAQVQKMAAYIGLRLAPRLRRHDDGALGWEAFLRDLDTGPESARRALGLGEVTRISMYRSQSIRRAMNGLFGGTAPLLMGLGVLWAAATQHLTWQRLVALAGAGAVWGYALRFWLLERGTWRTVLMAFQAQRPGEGPGPRIPSPAPAPPREQPPVLEHPTT